jgi:hypothetical protein
VSAQVAVPVSEGNDAIPAVAAVAAVQAVDAVAPRIVVASALSEDHVNHIRVVDKVVEDLALALLAEQNDAIQQRNDLKPVGEHEAVLVEQHYGCGGRDHWCRAILSLLFFSSARGDPALSPLVSDVENIRRDRACHLDALEKKEDKTMKSHEISTIVEKLEVSSKAWIPLWTLASPVHLSWMRNAVDASQFPVEGTSHVPRSFPAALL